MNQIETIYDITDIPYFPYAPGLIEWLVFCFAALLLLAASTLGPRLLHSRKKLISAYRTARAELTRMKSMTHLDPDLSHLSVMLRRFLALSSDPSLSAMTASELAQYREQCASPQLKEILTVILEMDQNRYNPQRQPLPADFLTRTITLLDAYHATLTADV